MSQAPLFQDLTFNQRQARETLQQLDDQFLHRLHQHNAQWYADLIAYRQGQTFSPTNLSTLLINCASVLEAFIADLFSIQATLDNERHPHQIHQTIFQFKKWLVLRRARRRLAKQENLPPFKELDTWLTRQLNANNLGGLALVDREYAVAQLAENYLQDKTYWAESLEQLTCWCLQALKTPEGQAAVKTWSSFHLSQQRHPHNLVPTVPLPEDTLNRLQTPNPRQRMGFSLTDYRLSARAVQDEIHYCVYCHEHAGDFCAKGFPQKKDQPALGFKTDAFGNFLTGCPLEEKISEMHWLKREGYPIAALAVLMIDNPMCPVTGHRICNDCMKSCIYQKQEPVNIPQIETRILNDVLHFPWGVEIYDLLTRWNPLRAQQYLPKPYNGLKVLIIGQGPAGFTLAHHLLMEGFAVVGVDGLKIEPLTFDWQQPIEDYQKLQEDLAKRVTLGFGGVAEYGITVRWDKNFLKLIYLNLLRRPYYQVFGNVRFGGTITVEQAWELGFDHLAIAVGAGLPQALPIPNSLAPGMRQANDFLMALQLTGAAKANSLTSLQIRLPAVVIGGGLTGIDTATELQAYYLLQIEKILTRYEKLIAFFGETTVHAQLDPLSFEILCEYLTHARALRAERERAALTHEEPQVQKLLHQWGGVTIVYRRKLQDAPAYQRNHEEVIKALEEGILYLECVEPVAVRLDEHGQTAFLVGRRWQQTEKGEWQATEQQVFLPAKNILVATGAKPNIAYEFEHRGTFIRNGFEYQPHEQQADQLIPITGSQHCKAEPFGPFTSYNHHDHRVTFLGDTHPTFHGSVVKAIASAARTYPHIVNALQHKKPVSESYQAFAQRMNEALAAEVVHRQNHPGNVLEVQVRAPLAAKNFQPGQFFRLQTYETSAPVLENTLLQMEALAVLGAEVDKEKGILHFMILQRGTSSRLARLLRPGDKVALMGPTGVRSKIPDGGETILIIGGRLAIANVQAMGQALSAQGNHLIFMAILAKADDVYQQTAIENVTDSVIWGTQQSPIIPPKRPQDQAVIGNLAEILTAYATGELPQSTPLQQIHRIIVVGDSQLIKQVREMKNGKLKNYFSAETQFFGAVHSNMQCMLKGVCAQCLQWQIDPETGQRTKAVFACSWQEQPIDLIDLDHLAARLTQNRLQEQLNDLWLNYLVQGEIDNLV